MKDLIVKIPKKKKKSKTNNIYKYLMVQKNILLEG